MVLDVLFVGLGGALGAICRYLLGLVKHGWAFPLMTFIANMLGSLAIGFIAGMMAALALPSQVALLLQVGLCGGLTTVSTFSLETLSLIEKGEGFTALAYAFGTAFGSVIGVLLGASLAKLIW